MLTINPQLVPKVFVNCNHIIQLHEKDGNCSIYALEFIQALVETFANPEARRVIESYDPGKSFIENAPLPTHLQRLFGYDRLPASIIARTVIEEMKKHLPDFYNRYELTSSQGEIQETLCLVKPWEGPGGLEEILHKRRWDASRVLLKDTLEKAQASLDAYFQSNQ